MEISSKILSDITHHMKYAKYLPEKNRRETWEETITRNMNMHIKKFPELSTEIEEAYQLVYDKKILPSMRSLQFGGRPIEINPIRLYNCSFAPVDHPDAFSEAMILLLAGSGFGYSVQTHHVEKLPEIRKPSSKRTRRFLVGDSIEGWADSIKVLMRSYFKGTSKIRFDFSDVRQKGQRLVTSGGKAPGPQPLKECILKIKGILNAKENGEQLEPIEVHDIMCHIADCVMAGGIRRAACIALFSYDDEKMMSCKTGHWWDSNSQRGRANNSVVLHRARVEKEDFMKIWDRVEKSNCGEPGFSFTNDIDSGFNPCHEISLRRNSFCNLVEVNVNNVEDQEDFEDRCRKASFIATLQASYTDFHYLRPIWRRNTEKDFLIGVGMTGLASDAAMGLNYKSGARVVNEENERAAKLMGIKPSARTTTVKPSGSSSLILGTSSGIHAWHAEYYIRRVRVGKGESIYAYLRNNHPELIEDEYFSPHDTAVISVPQKAPEGAITRSESALGFLGRVRRINVEWVAEGHRRGPNKNNVSATIPIKKEEWKEVGEWMWDNRSKYSGLSMLPYDGGTYIQAPFEECSKEEYERLMTSLIAVDLTRIEELTDETDLQGSVACAGGACTIESF